MGETEAAYMKILESSQTLLHVLKRETVNLTKKKQGSENGCGELASSSVKIAALPFPHHCQRITADTPPWLPRHSCVRALGDWTVVHGEPLHVIIMCFKFAIEYLPTFVYSKRCVLQIPLCHQRERVRDAQRVQTWVIVNRRSFRRCLQ